MLLPGLLHLRFSTALGSYHRAIRALLALPDSDLWIGFQFGGISLLRNGNATNYTTSDGVPEGGICGFAQDREGTIWAASTGGLARLEGNRWREVGKDWNFPGKIAHTVFVDREGSLWVSTEDTLVFLPAGATRRSFSGPADAIIFYRNSAGVIWWLCMNAFYRYEAGNLTRIVRPPEFPEVYAEAMATTEDGSHNLWLAADGMGLFYRKKGAWMRVEVPGGPARDGSGSALLSRRTRDRQFAN